MGNLKKVVGYRLQLLPISDDPNRAEHGCHLHIMQGAKTFAKINLKTGQLIGRPSPDIKRSDLRAILSFVNDNKEALIQEAENMRIK